MRRFLIAAGATAFTLTRAIAASPDSTTPTQEPRKFDFYRVGKLADRALTPVERTRLGITYLREEFAKPTGSYMGLGGTIDHVYVVAQLVLAISRPGAERDGLWQEMQRAPAGEYRDALALTLGLAGDERVTQHVVAYLQDVGNPLDLRERAARALGEMQQRSTVAVLVQVMMNDPVHKVRRSNPAPQSPLERNYPIRQAAWAALKHLERKGVDIGDEAREALRTPMFRVPIPPASAD